MDAFYVIAGIVTIASLFFSLWVYMMGKVKEGVETEKKASLVARLHDLYQIAEAVERQAHLIGNMADRENTTSKELKHLAISLLCTINTMQTSISSEMKSKEKWIFGVPDEYLFIDRQKDINKDEITEIGENEN